MENNGVSSPCAEGKIQKKMRCAPEFFVKKLLNNPAIIYYSKDHKVILPPSQRKTPIKLLLALKKFHIDNPHRKSAKSCELIDYMGLPQDRHSRLLVARYAHMLRPVFTNVGSKGHGTYVVSQISLTDIGHLAVEEIKKKLGE